ncbi:neurturin [Mugil cephalus]|uniref:neurturin n=1 Tax=Mugil cephalus TaxID=48193 RepID=UPI001FB7535A|nr:neurturin [Mugil cephalus]
MKLWKGATFAFVLCGAALSTILVRNMATVGQFQLKTKHPNASSPSPGSLSLEESASVTSPATSSPPSPRAASPRQPGGLHRRVRSTDNMSSLLSELSTMFQSFTEGELQHVVEILLNRKRRKNQRLGENPARRTKRARRSKPCSLRRLELTVSELGLGYQSDETVMLQYCTGHCQAERHNYDITMKHMRETVFRKKGRKDKVSTGPCCRPTAFEKNFSFLDNESHYHTIRNVSAKTCGCV